MKNLIRGGNRSFVIFLFFISLILGACASQEKIALPWDPLLPEKAKEAEEAPGVTPELRRIGSADPREDFLEAIKNGDIYFIAVNGFIQYTPGIFKDDFKCIVERLPVRVVFGTGDFIASDEHLRLNDVATEYARKFNILMFEKIFSEKKLRCPDGVEIFIPRTVAYFTKNIIFGRVGRGIPMLAWDHNDLGVFFAHQGKFEESEKEFMLAIQISEHQNSARYHSNLGLLYFIQENYILAEREFKEAIKIDPNHFHAKENLKRIPLLIKQNGSKWIQRKDTPVIGGY